MDRSQRLLELMSRWTEQEEHGLVVRAADLCADCPELIPELERLHQFATRIDRLTESLDTPQTVSWDRDTAGSSSPVGVPALPGYTITRLLAEGGMGQVYQGRHVALEREVALKVVRPDRVSADLLARFRTEARAVAKLDHPHIVQIYEVGEYTPSEGGPAMPFLALEFVPGGNLEFKAGTAPMPCAEAARVVCLLARAMAHAHARGVVHRDLKPDNILIAPPADEAALNAAIGRPKITDFGLARRDDAPGSRITEPGSLMGTPHYMAPEQAEGEPVGPPADVYALGAILYRLLTGRVVFPSDSWVQVLYQACNTPPRPPRELVKDIPITLEALCLRCLSKKAKDRPTAAELAAELEPFSAPGRLATTVDFINPRPSRRRWLVAALLAVLAVPAAILGWQLARPAPVTVAVEPLKGYLDAQMTRKGDPLRQNIPLSDPAARPLRPGDEIRVEARLNRPAYVYLVWVDAAGAVTPMYPWIDGDWKRREPEVKAREFKLPQLAGSWEYWPMGPGKPGLETMVLLCRDDPLPEDVDVKKMLGTFGPQRFEGQDHHTIAWFANGETVRDEELRAPLTKPVAGSNPLERINREILRRVKGQFEYTRAITYGNEGDKP